MTTLLRKLLLLVRRDRATRDLEYEMRMHRELRAASLRDRGIEDADAESAARRRFGNSTQLVERSADEWGFGLFNDLGQDLRYAARRLRQRPGFTAAVVVVLALGIGATTAMFSAVDAALLRPLPFADPDELVTLRLGVPFERTRPLPANERPPDLTDAMRMPATFARVAAYASGALNLAERDRPLRVRAGVVTAGFFETLGITPATGRTFDSSDAAGPARVVILSWSLWKNHYGGRAVIDSTIPLNNNRHIVIGVMPEGFGFPDASDLWIPMAIPATHTTFEAFRGFLPSTTIARLAPGMTRDGAAAQLTGVWERFNAGFPRVAGRGYPSIDAAVAEVRASGGVMDLQSSLVGDRRRALLVLFGATTLLLLIACTNVTNLLLAYGASRRRELAVRAVLGASRSRVIRQLIAESVLLSLGGAALGLALAPLSLRLLALLMPPTMAGVAAASIDARVLLFTTVIAVMTGIAFGLWPAFGATRESAAVSIKSGGAHGASASGTRRIQHVLVGAEVALALVLLVGATLMLRSFSTLMGLDSGLASDRIATLEMSFARGKTRGERLSTVDQILARIRSVPGVTAAGMVNDLPFSNGGGVAISVEVPDSPAPGNDEYARYLVASGEYFAAAGVPMLSGRTFTAPDAAGSPPVAIINDVFARRYWPNGAAVGRTFRWGGDSVPVTVIGVVGHVRESGLDQDPSPQMYFPAGANLGDNVAFVVSGSLPPQQLLAHLRASVRAIDPAQAIANLRTMSDVIGKSVEARRANTLLISLFGMLAVVVAVFGVYAVTSYAVTQRARELGIRAALGATRAALLREMGTRMGVVCLSGIAIGAAGAWVASRVMSGLLYGVGVHDIGAFTIAPLVLLGAVVAATLVPARRATRVNPVDVIRAE